MKRTFCVILSICLLIGCLAVSTPVTAAPSEGVCGDNLTWKLDSNSSDYNGGHGTLIISGTGPMYDYSPENPAPWGNMGSYCIIEDGVTSIGDYAFAALCRSVQVAETVTEVGSKIFRPGTNNMIFLGGVPQIAEDAFEGVDGKFGYISGWTEADMQAYGGTPTWRQASISLTADTKTIYQLNEEIKPEDFIVKVTFAGMLVRNYTPNFVQTGAYSNAVTGEQSVNVTISGVQLQHRYIVTDGQSHFDMVQVTAPDTYAYTGKLITTLRPTVTAGSFTLVKGTDYTLQFSGDTEAGGTQKIEVIGMGKWKGLSKSVEFLITKRDITTLKVQAVGVTFDGSPATPKVNIASDTDSLDLKLGEDYIVICENNVNRGTATCRVVGIGNCYGVVNRTFTIGASDLSATLKGAYVGQADGELDDQQYYYEEVIMTPGKFTGTIKAEVNGSSVQHAAYYELYKVVGDQMQLVTTKQTDFGGKYLTQFYYDFSDVYETEVDNGGAVYALSYTWVDSTKGVYSGLLVLIIPAKVPEATQIGLAMVEDTISLRTVQLMAYGLDGALGEVSWTTSNPQIATVDRGSVTMLKPGTVTITAHSGDLTASITIIGVPEDLSTGEIIRNTAVADKFSVYYDGYLLQEGTDYVKEVTILEDGKLVKITGTGALSGELVQQFDANNMLVGHTHGYMSACDTTCHSCDEVRTAQPHMVNDVWAKDSNAHWHTCENCGEKLDHAQHTLSAEDENMCTVCGQLYMPGDMDGNYTVDNKDVEYLLWHTLFSESFPLNQSADLDGSGTVDNKDVEYLLWHTLFPESYPL